LKRLNEFVDLGYPLLIGASRKSMIGRILKDRDVADRVTGTVAVHYHAMMQGARIIRVHDVKEANDSVLVYNALSNYEF
jgi:dihydropteroate synthase